YYSLGSDQVVLPEKSQFPSADHYYQTALHELGHASGHPGRLNRETLQKGLEDGFGSESYAREELRAEISAMMTGDRLGTGHDPSRGAAYVSGWVEVLDKNPQEIVNASADAQRMSNYLISRTQERQQEQGGKTQNGPVSGQQPDRQYHIVPVPHRTGVYRIQDAQDPNRPVPSPYGGMYGPRDDAERAIERLHQDRKQGRRAPEPVRAARGAIVERPSKLGRTESFVTSSRDGAVVRGSGRPGVRQDQFPSRTTPER
ncbi:MAG: zincin-like metallopeptidase domain-containing protein, partial [Acidobacteriota bacterium]|nr:zincin-like metallopeptidase domain-containing protein [Acidobacteriota bacterium]